MKNKIYKILLVIWMIIIFLFSNDPKEETSEKTNNFMAPIIEIIELITGYEKNSNEIELITDECFYLVRKLAHFLEYFILGLLLILALKSDIPNKEVLYYSAIIICIIYAASDEVHQLFVEGRNGNIKDVIIDSCGSISSITCYYYYSWKKKIDEITR